jgi:hypothetical protein
LTLAAPYRLRHIQGNALSGDELSTAPSTLREDGTRMTLIEAAEVMERLQRRAAHQGEVQALQAARDALLILASEGHATLGDRLHRDSTDGDRAGTRVA